VRRAVRQIGSEDIGRIVREYNGSRFGFASRNFYAAFLAALDVSRDAERYFGVLERQDPDSYWIVKLPVYLPLGALTEQLELDPSVMRTLNPALQRSVWRGKKYLPKDYHLRLPSSVDSTDVTMVLNHIVLADGREDQVPDILYRVERGDTLSQIAERFNTDVRELMALNNLQSKDMIRIGQSLRLIESVGKAAEFASVRLVSRED
jgi:membrane-bound lytic murein transglycosylase D